MKTIKDFKIIAIGLIFVIFVQALDMPSYAQVSLPKPGIMVHLSLAYNSPILKGIKINPNNPFKFEFILDVGDGFPVQLVDDQGVEFYWGVGFDLAKEFMLSRKDGKLLLDGSITILSLSHFHPPVENEVSAAMIGGNGGIDLSSDKALAVKTVYGDDKGIEFHLDLAQLAQWKEATGAVFTIRQITPLIDLHRWLGFNGQKA